MKKHILFVLENTEVTHDIRVWPEAEAAKEFGYDVTVISPVKLSATLKHEVINGIEIYRHPMPVEASGKFAFLFEYITALFWELFLALKIYKKKPFHIIHSANPPDHVFLLAWLFKPFKTTKGSKGMGIGVYEAREIILAIGGHIEVRSEVNEGTCFKLTIPAAN